jgi:virulence factor
MKLVKWRIGIVGLGGIASKAYLPVLSQRSDVEILVCSRTLSTVEEVQARYGLPHGTTELDELLSFKLDAAFVLTPSPTHFAVAQKLLDAGVDVFVEKPATLKSEETKALAELAEARGRVLMVGFNRRFAPLHQRARELWAGRTVGLALLQKHRSSAAHPDLFSNYIDDTIHIIDLLRFFCGVGGGCRHRHPGARRSADGSRERRRPGEGGPRRNHHQSRSRRLERDLQPSR